MPTASHRAQRRLLRDDACTAIRSAILEGALSPGSRLVERSLEQWLGTSRTPIREALRTLEREGFVETVPQSHTRVAVPDVAELRDTMDAVGAVMGAVAFFSVPTLNVATSAHILSALRTLGDAADRQDAQRVLEALLDVHTHITSSCTNLTVRRVVDGLLFLFAFQLRTVGGDLPVNWGEQRAAVNELAIAIGARDALAAHAAIGRLHDGRALGSDAPWHGEKAGG